MRATILSGSLILLTACAAPRAVSEAEACSVKSSDAMENERVPAAAVPYQAKVTLGDLIRSDSSRDPGSRIESSPTGRSPSLVSALRKMIGGVTEFYQPVRTSDEQGTPVLGDTKRSLVQSKVFELWLKDRATPWREGEVVENDGWRLKLLSAGRSSGGRVFEIEVLQEGE